jgi:hypothetical protein
MRKGYGPSGISFNYGFDRFKADVAMGIEFRFELVIAGNTFSPTFDLQSCTESELRAFYDKADALTLGVDGPLIHIFA